MMKQALIPTDRLFPVRSNARRIGMTGIDEDVSFLA
jgi:hypothetical protein